MTTLQRSLRLGRLVSVLIRKEESALGLNDKAASIGMWHWCSGERERDKKKIKLRSQRVNYSLRQALDRSVFQIVSCQLPYEKDEKKNETWTVWEHVCNWQEIELSKTTVVAVHAWKLWDTRMLPFSSSFWWKRMKQREKKKKDIRLDETTLSGLC